MAKVEGRTKYTLIILSCSDSILRALWEDSTPFFLFSRMIIFILMNELKKYSFTDVIIGLFRCASTQSIVEFNKPCEN